MDDTRRRPIDDTGFDSSTDGGIDPTESSNGFWMNVVVAVADELGTDPTSLPPIQRSINPDILDRLHEGESPKRLWFEYHGHEVVVSGDGDVRVRPQA